MVDRKTFLLAITAGILIKTALWLWAWSSLGVSPFQMMHGHDGAEYLEFARIIALGEWGNLPDTIVRHDSGLSLLLAMLYRATFMLIPMTALALAVQITSWIAGGWIFSRTIATDLGKHGAAALTAFLLAYPAGLYFGMFNLTEPVFTALLLGAYGLSRRNLLWQSMLLAGLAACVRSTGLLMVGAISLYCLANLAASSPKNKAAGLLKLGVAALIGIAPWIALQLLIRVMFHAGMETHKPEFGWPFSGFRGFADAGLIRVVYMMGVCGFFLASVAMLVRLALRKADESWRLAAVFSVIFLLFHICLKSLFYIDHKVWTFDYYDRYFVPLWPFALIACRRWLNRWTVAGAIAVSVFLTIWWTRNYLLASGMA